MLFVDAITHDTYVPSAILKGVPIQILQVNE